MKLLKLKMSYTVLRHTKTFISKRKIKCRSLNLARKTRLKAFLHFATDVYVAHIKYELNADIE